MGIRGGRWFIAAAVAALGAGLALASPAAVADDRLVYVALGDSFTSGPLVLPHDDSRVPQDCGQSMFNYPHVVAFELGVDEFRDMSCGSATIDHLYEAQDDLPLGSTNAPQFTALGPEVDIVTLGMSGNDVGFAGTASDCIRLMGPPMEQPCSAGLNEGGVDKVAARIAKTEPELGQAIRDIHRLAPQAEVYVVGYPAALPDNGVGCWPYLPILNEDMPYLVARFKDMNAMVKRAAEANDATFVDIYTSSVGHDACKPPALAWVNGAVLVPPSFPAHPNQFGLANAADDVADIIRPHR